MMRIKIDELLRDQWSLVIARHFQMTLASSTARVRSLVVSFTAPGHPTGHGKEYLCELRGRHPDGRELRIRSAHSDPETAIGHAFARTRRELRRKPLRATATID